MKHAWIALTLTTTLCAAGCSEAPSDPTPEGAILQSVTALRKNDLRGFLEATLPQAEMSAMAGEWNNKRVQPVSKEEKAQFQQQMGMLTQDGAEERLFALAAPQLQKMKPQIAGMAGFISGMAEMQLEQDETLGDTEKEMAKKMIGGFASWLQNNDITDEGKLKKAIGIVCKTARKLDLATLDQVTSLNFFQVLDKGDVAIGGLKDVLDVYGMDINAFLKSVEAEQLSLEGDTATVRVSFTFLGEQHSVETEMMQRNGRWFGKSALEKQAAGQGELQASF